MAWSGVGDVLGGLAVAAACFVRTFGGARSSFWRHMTQTGAILGGLAVLSTPELRRPRLGWRDLLGGLASAGGLYLVFQVGDRLARIILPRGAREVDDIYALRTLGPWPELALRLALVIGPAEELFWRGFLQRRLARRLGAWPAAAVETACYGGVHVASRNLTLMAAASVAGAYWSALAAAGASMSTLVVSHIVWDVWIFLVAPTQGESAVSPRAFAELLRRLRARKSQPHSPRRASARPDGAHSLSRGSSTSRRPSPKK